MSLILNDYSVYILENGFKKKSYLQYYCFSLQQTFQFNILS